MKASDLDKELGRSKGFGRQWAKENGVEFIFVGKRRMYVTERVAEEMVRRRTVV